MGLDLPEYFGLTRVLLNNFFVSHLDKQDYNRSMYGSYFQCGLCSKMFRSDSYLDQHVETRHGASLGTGCVADHVGLNTLFRRGGGGCKVV